MSDQLYLQIRAPDKPDQQGTRSWLFRYRRNGKHHWMGIGSCELFSLADARARVLKLRQLLSDGVDPLAARREGRLNLSGTGPLLLAPEDVPSAEEPATKETAPTFRECVASYIESHGSRWHNPKHAQQWTSTLETYAGPVIGDLPVDEVTVDHLVKILEPLWTTKTETAVRLRGRIEAVLGWAQAKGYRDGVNPATWRGGALQHLLPPPARIKAIKPRHSLPCADLPAFMGRLRALRGDDRLIAAARCLEFTILTGLRTNEARLTVWSEIDLEARLLSIPGERMKMRKPFRVPLSDRAIAIVKAMPRDRELVFGTLRENALRDVVALLHDGPADDKPDVHGFRATLHTWLAEQTDCPEVVAEAVLAHFKGGVVGAYQRSDHLDQRRPLMQRWADYCATAPAKGQD